MCFTDRLLVQEYDLVDGYLKRRVAITVFIMSLDENTGALICLGQFLSFDDLR